MITAKKFINLGLAAILVLALGLPQTDSPLLAASPERAPNLSSWSPPQTINGWWPDLSPNGRFITYGNWGESWVTDLQTGQNWDFRDPADIANRAHRCMAGRDFTVMKSRSASGFPKKRRITRNWFWAITLWPRMGTGLLIRR